MYYIIENTEQLRDFTEFDLSSCYLDIILNNDNYHPAISEVSLIYIKPLISKKGFIISIDHTESFGLPFEEVIEALKTKLDKIYTANIKKILYFFNENTNILCLKTAKYFESTEIFKEDVFNTPAHNFYYSKCTDIKNINNIIPISKHYEKYENIYSSFKVNKKIFEQKYYKFYSYFTNNIFHNIEKNGLLIDEDRFLNSVNIGTRDFSIKDSKVYTNYNLFTLAGRPSNSFNNLNFASFPKEGEARKCILCENDYLIEFDYSSYHIKILSKMVGYEFPDDDIHTFLGKFYFKKEVLSEEEYDQSKQITFKILYNEKIINDFTEIPFFSLIKDMKEEMWDFYQENKYINTHISKRPIYNIENKNQLLPYLMQFYETERNILVLNELQERLNGMETKLVLYTYDSFLLDYSKNDGKQLLLDINNILEQDGYPVSTKYGKNYGSLKELE
jgi:hypothetical protein